MDEALIFDTSFLIDLQRERAGGSGPGPATRFLMAHAEATMALPMTALGEFAEGFTDPDDPILQHAARAFDLLPVDEQTAYRYAQAARWLRRKGTLVGANDLWIAACALRHGRPLVTRNLAEFRRVPGLRVLAY